MQPPAGSSPPRQTPPSAPPNPAPVAPTPSTALPSPNSGGNIPRGDEFDLSILPDTYGEKKLFPAGWSRAWVVVAGLLAVYCLWFFAYGMGTRAQKPLPLPIGTSAPVAAASTVTVHVVGAVARPGVYSLSASARVADAIAQAGGATAEGDTTNLNMAAFAQDGAQIVVPVRVVPTSNVAPSSSAAAPSPPVSMGQSPSATDTASPSAAAREAQIEYLRAHPIDLNQASSFELQQLPGVGPARAEEIIAYRNSIGRFRSVSDLDNVKGIGEKRMEALKDLVVVR